ncbi:MAG: DUF1761 domain-containing protein [Melioribacteraceae bacterium]|nr:DUF1761 domain-containing protein [Melioribacteraceae bacterium]
MEGAQIHINYFAVIAVTILAFVIGGLWYGPIFGKPWMKETKITEEDAKKSNMVKIFGTSIILNFIIAINLSMFLGPKPDLAWGLMAGALAGVGWVSASLGIIYLFSQKSLKLFLIDAGYQTVIYTIMGGVLGVWK